MKQYINYFNSNIPKLIIVFAFGLLAFSANAQTADTTFIDYKSYRDRVLSYSKDILKSEQNKKSIESALKYAKTAYLPRLDFSGSAQYRINDYDISFGQMNLAMPHENYSLQAQLSQVIYNGGQINNSVKAAKIQDSIATGSIDLTLQNISYAAQLNYWNAVATRAMDMSMKEYVSIVNSLVEVLRTRFKDGLIAKTDYLQALSRLKEAEMSASETSKAYQLSLQNLNIMIGQDPMTPISPLDSISFTLEALEYMTVDEALMQRPDYRISQLTLDYQKRQLKIIQSSFNPQLSVGMQQSWGTQMLNFDGSTKFITTAFASLKVPIFAWGARYKKSNSQKAIINSAELDRQATLDNISKEVASSWTEYVENTNQIKLAKHATIISKESMNLNTFSYTEGRLTILDVLSSSNSLS